MIPTLLLPILEPYGDPCTMFNPKAHHLRKVEFFNWVEETKRKYHIYQAVPLRITSNLVTEGSSIIEGFQEDTTSFVPSSPVTSSGSSE
ncbi:hypothetical protein [Metabacillus litoralis]|uniref:hypothetical protein n=1 Tax=Metabacillus litoralis TaxID=152268 RepID=UPI001CFF28FA|nr:hypothetical protein [Metabacillus litoralis]